MFLSDAAVKRPVAMTCLIIALTFLGMNSYRKMGLELLPKMDIPYITVTTLYPGATPVDIEVDVAKKIEDAVSSIDGLKHVTSTCMENACQTIIEFNIGVDVNVAASDVREKIDTILDDFPAGVEKPVILKFDVNAKPVVTVALAGDLSIEDLYDYADNDLRDKLSVIPGVANVELLGGSEREVHVLLDRSKIAAAGLTSLQVMQALNNGVMSLPSGRVREKGMEYSVRYDAEYYRVKDIESLQVAGRNDARRYIADLGTVCMAAEERRQEAYVDSGPCIGIRVVKKADANAVKVVTEVKKALDKIKANLPGGMELIWITDDGAFIQSTVDSTTGSIWQGVLLTALILFCFLHSFRATFIVGITMPLTIIISLFFMKILDFTLNMSTLQAMGLSVGVLVTNSIIVLESIIGHFKQTGDAKRAACDGTAEVAVAVLASALTNVVVLLPIGMMSSIIGIFFRPFAWTTLTVNVVSLFVSFTLTPILCAKILKTEKEDSFLARFERRWNGILDAFAGGYANRLRKISSRKVYILGLLLIIMTIFFHALTFAPKIGFSFMPQADRGEVLVKLEYSTRQNLAETVRRAQEVEAILKKLPSLEHTFTTIGKVEGVAGRNSEGVYMAQVLLKFVDKTERKTTVWEYLDVIRKQLKNYPGCIIDASIPSLIGGQEIPVEMEIFGDDLKKLDRAALAVQEIVQKMPGIETPDTTVREGKTELRIFPNRAILADISTSVNTMGVMLRANLEGIKAGTYKSGARTYDIRVKFKEEDGKDQVREFVFPGKDNQAVLLTNFADIRERMAPVQITRDDKSRISKMFSQLAPSLPLSNAVKMISAIVDQSGIMPPGYTYVFRGTYERMQEGVADFLEAGLLAILLTYLALAAILESFIRPFLILVTIPLGLVGILWALHLTGLSISIYVLLGAVMLVGIVVNIAVLIMDHAQQLITKDAKPRDAILTALRMEFRAVVMVTLASVLGMLPLATSSGLGSELCNGIGVSSVGGILISAIFTLIVLPLVFILFSKEATESGGRTP